MNLYHGSNVLFDEFNKNTVIHLAPSIDYAINYAFYKVDKFGGIAYLYVIEYENYKNISYTKYMENFRIYNTNECSMIFKIINKYKIISKIKW